MYKFYNHTLDNALEIAALWTYFKRKSYCCNRQQTPNTIHWDASQTLSDCNMPDDAGISATEKINLAAMTLTRLN